MLVNPNWDRNEITVDAALTLENLIAWLRMQPPETTYGYCDNGDCLIARYLKGHGFTNVRVYPEEVRIDGRRHRLSSLLNYAAHAHNYGEALERAKSKRWQSNS